jgi:hypothetical protein
MRYSYVLHYPGTAPFDRDREDQWRSFLGEFVRKVADKFPDLLFWCSEHETAVKFRVQSDSSTVHDFIKKRIGDLNLKFHPTEEDGETLLSDLGKDRFFNESTNDPAAKKRRALNSL